MNRISMLQQPCLSACLTLMFVVVMGFPLTSMSAEMTEVEARPAPELSLPDLEGNIRKLDDAGFAGKVILVNFWASWCRPCVTEIPSIRRLAKKMGELQVPFTVIGINVGEGIRRVSASVSRLKIDYTVLLDQDSSAFDKWKATVLPTAYVVDGNGQLRFFAQGPVEWDNPDIVEKLLKLATSTPPQ